MLYIDTSCNDDFDTVVRHLNSSGIPMATRNKLKLVVSADVTVDFAKEMLKSNNFKDLVTYGETPLDK